MDYNFILNLAVAKYNGEIRTAIAANLYGEAVVFDCNNQVPIWADQEEINRLESEVNTFINQTQNSNSDVSITTLPTDPGTEKQPDEKAEETEAVEAAEAAENPETGKKFTDAELFAVILEANKSNVTIGEAIKKLIFNNEEVNNYQIGHVKGLITQLLNSQAAEKVEEVAPDAEKPAEAAENVNSEASQSNDEAKAAEENP